VDSKRDYLSRARVNSSIYEENPLERVGAMYRTARRGNIARALRAELWQLLEPLYSLAVANALPQDRPDFDSCVLERMFAVGAALGVNGKRGGFGIGQKMINLMMKDLWATGRVGGPVAQCLHAPLDRIVLNSLNGVPPTWHAWSKVEAPELNSATVEDYMRIQRGLRSFCDDSGGRFTSVIELEHFIWSGIDLP